MGNVIQGGSNGNTVNVDDNNRLLTYAVTESQSISSAREGDVFSLTHTNINLTTDGLSFLLYVNNGDNVDWVLSDIKTQFGLSTGGDGGDFTSQVVVDPSGGTLITAGTPTGGINLKVGDPQVLSGTFLYGAEGSTILGGASLSPGMVIKDQAIQPFSSAPIILPPSTSFSYGVTPPAGNTNMSVKVTMTIFRDTKA